MQTIKAEKEKLGIRIDPDADPAHSGMIGAPLTPITSNTGYLNAKQTSINPNFAAVVVDLIGKAQLKPGSTVAVGVSGSFPALNVATLAALHEMKLKPILISSVAASEWGANQTNFTWLDMETLLHAKKIFDVRSVAASRGGIDDTGYGMSKRGRSLLDEAISRADLPNLEAESVKSAIDQRMDVYDERAGKQPIRAYINVGGGSASVGTHVGKKQLAPGLNTTRPRGTNLVDSVMLRFLDRDIPVIHITSIVALAREYGLAIEPRTMPQVGDGLVYTKAEYNRWLSAIGILAVFGTMFAFIRWDVGLRLLRRSNKTRAQPQPEQMI
jgi:poly-gamma-glutamate system protein